MPARRRKKDPERVIDYHYFSQRLVPAYEDEHGEIPGLVLDPRGHLHEAHPGYGDEPHEVGTEFVAKFVPPDYEYDKVLYVEKHGFAQTLVDDQLGQRNDMAILASKGYGTVANRELLEKFADEGYEVYVLHDCDIDGFGILANLQLGNGRAAGLYEAAVDLGLRLEDAREMGLLGEEIVRKKSIPEGVVTYVTDEESALFTGTQIGPKEWMTTRVELNEIPSDERVAFVERRLEAAGVGPKVVPPDDYLRAQAERLRDHDLDDRIRDALMEAVGDEVVSRLMPVFGDDYDLDGAGDRLEDEFSVPSELSWRAVVYGEIYVQGRRLEDAIREAVRGIVRIVDGEAGRGRGGTTCE